MNFFLLVVLTVFSFAASAQDSLQINHIDNLTARINSSELTEKRDSIIQDYQNIGLSMKVYISTAMDGNELKKYSNVAVSVRNENGAVKKAVTSTTLYYHEGELIKGEEYLIENDIKQSAEWYFSDDRPVHWTSTLDDAEAEARAFLLISMAKTLSSQIQKL